MLKPEVQGEEVSQLLAKDSFEGYAEGRFPSQGGWLLNGKTDGIVEQPLPGSQTIPADRQDSLREDGQKRQTGDQAKNWKAEDAGLKETRERTSLIALLAKRVTLVDSNDSVTGLRSLRLMSDVPVELVLAKPLDLPTAAPFGVSEGNFTIGEAPETKAGRTLSRSRALDRLRREEEGKRTRMNDDSTTEEKRLSSEEADVTTKTAQTRSVSLPSGKSTKLMSSAPVGNLYIYSFDGKLLQVYDIYGTLLKDFVYVGNRLVAEYDHVNARLLYYTPDQINSTRVITDGVGNIVYSASYDPYGNVRTQTGSIEPMLKFSGKECDAESQLDYFAARYYDRSQFRFMSVDPNLSEQAATNDSRRWNLYVYCVDSPITYIDPTGRSAAVFDRKTNMIAVIQGNGQLWDWFPAGNNVPTGIAPWPAGTYMFAYWASPENAGYYGWDFDGIDGWGAYVFNVNGRSGMSLHAGRVGVWDTNGQTGWGYYTSGCIRTVDEVMAAFDYLGRMGDSITRLTVFDDFRGFAESILTNLAITLMFSRS